MTVIIGIDPHKRSHTAVALDQQDQVLGELRVAADSFQLRRLLKFAGAWTDRVWGVENANGLGRLIARQLVEAGETVVDVPAKLSAQVRTVGRGAQDRHPRRLLDRGRVSACQEPPACGRGWRHGAAGVGGRAAASHHLAAAEDAVPDP